MARLAALVVVLVLVGFRHLAVLPVGVGPVLPGRLAPGVHRVFLPVPLVEPARLAAGPGLKLGPRPLRLTPSSDIGVEVVPSASGAGPQPVFTRNKISRGPSKEMPQPELHTALRQVIHAIPLVLQCND